jgi:hypothetical protein
VCPGALTLFGDVMAKNLLLWVRHLTPKERNLIIGAVKTFGSEQYRTLRYDDKSMADILFFDPKNVTALLCEVYSYQEDPAALDLAHKLKGEPPQKRRRVVTLRRSR